MSAGAALRGHFTWYVIFRLRCHRYAGKILFFSKVGQQYRNTKSGHNKTIFRYLENKNNLRISLWAIKRIKNDPF